MGFQPGQFITATRLNRLQPVKYWMAATAPVTGAVTNTDITGMSQSIIVGTDGATASFWWSVDFRNGAVAGAGQAAVRPFWDVNGAPIYAIFDSRTALEKGSCANAWSTTIPTAGTYTFKLQAATLLVNQSTNIYTTLLVEITEVA